MADDTDTTRPGEAAAVEAALDRATWTATISAVEVGEVVKVAMSLPAADIATEVVAAAYPVIAAAVREQAAQDIEREAEREKDHFPPRWPGDTFWEGVTSGKRRAAGIARDSR